MSVSEIQSLVKMTQCSYNSNDDFDDDNSDDDDDDTEQCGFLCTVHPSLYHYEIIYFLIIFPLLNALLFCSLKLFRRKVDLKNANCCVIFYIHFFPQYTHTKNNT
jgi:uncharacterized membrane protein YfhO